MMDIDLMPDLMERRGGGQQGGFKVSARIPSRVETPCIRAQSDWNRLLIRSNAKPLEHRPVSVP